MLRDHTTPGHVLTAMTGFPMRVRSTESSRAATPDGIPAWHISCLPFPLRRALPANRSNSEQEQVYRSICTLSIIAARTLSVRAFGICHGQWPMATTALALGWG